MKQRQKYITNRILLYFLGLIFFILVWFLISLFFKSNLIFPSPFETFSYAFYLLGESYTYICLGTTLLKMFLGFFISAFFAFLIAFFAGSHESVYLFFRPMITVLKSIPTATLVFLFIVLADAKNAPIYVVVLVSFPILYESMVSGMHNVNEHIIEAAKTDGASLVETALKIRLPLSMPYVVVGILSSFALSFKIEIMAEIITGYTKNGIGSVIKFVQIDNPTDMVPVFAYSLIAISCMLTLSLIASIIRKTLIKKGKVIDPTHN